MCPGWLTQCLEKYWTYNHQNLPWCILGQGGVLQVLESKVQGHGWSSMLEDALFGIVNVMS